jgi:cardiolipin synthase
MTVDGQVANVGSANINSRSLNCDEEINMVIFDHSIVRILDRHFDDDLERSVRIDPSRWKRRSVFQHIKEKLVAPLRRVS